MRAVASCIYALCTHCYVRIAILQSQIQTNLQYHLKIKLKSNYEYESENTILRCT